MEGGGQPQVGLWTVVEPVDGVEVGACSLEKLRVAVALVVAAVSSSFASASASPSSTVVVVLVVVVR